MTEDDKRRLADIDQQLANPDIYFSAESDRLRELTLVRRLLDEATAERDTAMAALREIAVMDGHALFAENARNVVNRDLAAHSAATKPADPIEKAGSDG